MKCISCGIELSSGDMGYTCIRCTNKLNNYSKKSDKEIIAPTGGTGEVLYMTGPTGAYQLAKKASGELILQRQLVTQYYENPWLPTDTYSWEDVETVEYEEKEDGTV